MTDTIITGIAVVVLVAVVATLASRTPSSLLFDLIGRLSSHGFPTRRR